MTEEKVTKSILRLLVEKGWEIVSYDFPQSGTGTCLHPNIRKGKTDKIWIPDIITTKNNICLIFENKNRLYPQDFEKLERISTSNEYSNDLAKLIGDQNNYSIFYGVGLPMTCLKKIETLSSKVDFILGVNEDGTITKVTQTEFDL